MKPIGRKASDEHADADRRAFATRAMTLGPHDQEKPPEAEQERLSRQAHWRGVFHEVIEVLE